MCRQTTVLNLFFDGKWVLPLKVQYFSLDGRDWALLQSAQVPNFSGQNMFSIFWRFYKNWILGLPNHGQSRQDCSSGSRHEDHENFQARSTLCRPTVAHLHTQSGLILQSSSESNNVGDECRRRWRLRITNLVIVLQEVSLNVLAFHKPTAYHLGWKEGTFKYSGRWNDSQKFLIFDVLKNVRMNL